MTAGGPTLRATLVADLRDRGPWRGRPCDGCGSDVAPRSSWVVAADHGRGTPALLCDDCTARAWRDAWEGATEADGPDGSGRPRLRVVR